MGFLMQIPSIYKWLTIVTLALALLAFGWMKGADHVQTQWDATIIKQSLAVAQAQIRPAEATAKVITEYVNRVKVVKEAGQSTIKEVPVYVPIEADSACAINRGFMRVHDAAASGELPGNPQPC